MADNEELLKKLTHAENTLANLIYNNGFSNLSIENKDIYRQLKKEIGELAFELYELHKTKDPDKEIYYFYKAYLAYHPKVYEPLVSALSRFGNHNCKTKCEVNLNVALFDNSSDELCSLAIASILGIGQKANLNQALFYLNKSIEKKHAVSLSLIGFLYTFGYGVEIDYKLAQKYYLMAIQENELFAHYRMGCLYIDGHGVGVDIDKAEQYFKIAAKQGFALAQFSLGFLYEKSEYFDLKYQKAAMWYYRSAIQGFELTKIYLQEKTNEYLKFIHCFLDKNYKKCAHLLTQNQEILFSIINNISKLDINDSDLGLLFDWELLKLQKLEGSAGLIYNVVYHIDQIRLGSNNDDERMMAAKILSLLLSNINFEEITIDYISYWFELIVNLYLEQNLKSLVNPLKILWYKAESVCSHIEIFNVATLKYMADIFLKIKSPSYYVNMNFSEINKIHINQILSYVDNDNSTTQDLEDLLAKGIIINNSSEVKSVTKSTVYFFSENTDLKRVEPEKPIEHIPMIPQDATFRL